MNSVQIEIKTARQEQIIRAFWENLINTRDIARWQALASPDIIFVGSLSSREWKGYDGIAEYAPLMFNRFENFHLKLGAIITEGEKSVVMLTFSGRNTAGLFGNPPCGKQVTYDAVGITTIKQDKIVDVRVTGNVIQILEQIGQTV